MNDEASDLFYYPTGVEVVQQKFANIIKMSRCKLKYLFCAQILFGLVNAGIILQNETYEIPEVTVIEITYPPPVFSLTRSDRCKLDMVYGYENVEFRSELYLVEDHDLIDRNTTGIYFAESDPNAHQGVKYTPRPDFFDKIGKFEFYQNLEELSAITRFTNLSSGEVTYTGMLRQKYVIKDAPEIFSQRMGAIILSGFIQYYNETYDSPDCTRKVNESEGQGGQNPPKVVYPKVLLSPSFTLTQREKGPENFVRELIAMMNSADMSFRTISDPIIRLHISGIIVPQDESTHPYIKPVSRGSFIVDAPTTTRRPRFVSRLPPENYTGFDTLYYTGEHFREEKQRFPIDRHNMVVVLTEHLMADNDGFGTLSVAAGVAHVGALCERLTRMSGVISVTYQMVRLGIMSMTHELGHAFGATHEGEDKAADCSATGQFTMVSGYLGTFWWSRCNKRNLKEFFESAESACSNGRPVVVPDSKTNLPGAWMPIAGHCLNVLKDSAPGLCVPGKAYGCVNNATCVSPLNQLP